MPQRRACYETRSESGTFAVCNSSPARAIVILSPAKNLFRGLKRARADDSSLYHAPSRMTLPVAPNCYTVKLKFLVFLSSFRQAHVQRASRRGAEVTESAGLSSACSAPLRKTTFGCGSAALCSLVDRPESFGAVPGNLTFSIQKSPGTLAAQARSSWAQCSGRACSAP